MNKKEREEIDEIRALRGLVPWSAREYDWIIAEFDRRRAKRQENFEMAKEFEDLKVGMKSLTGKELQNFQQMVLIGDIFHRRYPDQAQYKAHFYRFHSINRFLQTYHTELLKLKFIDVKNGKHHILPQLIDSLCTLEYNLDEEDESGNPSCFFVYSQVINATKTKINARLN